MIWEANFASDTLGSFLSNASLLSPGMLYGLQCYTVDGSLCTISMISWDRMDAEPGDLCFTAMVQCSSHRLVVTKCSTIVAESVSSHPDCIPVALGSQFGNHKMQDQWFCHSVMFHVQGSQERKQKTLRWDSHTFCTIQDWEFASLFGMSLPMLRDKSSKESSQS